MGSPSAALSTLRPDIADGFMEYDLEMDRRGFIAQRVLPVFETQVQAGSFGKIPLAQLLQTRDTLRAPGSGYARGKWKFTTDSYATQEHGAEEPVDDREAKMYANYFDAEMVSAMRAFDAVLRNAEQRAADLVFNATTWNGASLTTAVTNEWDDHANATPISDVEAAVMKVYDGSGLWPNSLVINRRVFRNLRQCDEVKDQIAASGAGDPNDARSITEQKLAEIFDLEQVIVAGSSKNTANEGQTAAFGQIWSNEYAMVAHIQGGQDVRRPSLGRTFHWGEDGSTIGGTFESYRQEEVRATILRVRHDVDEKILYVPAGHLLSNITT